MTWFRVDDGFAVHPKAVAAGNAALGLWVRAGAWCAKFRTDGELPRHMVGTLGAQTRAARRLVEVGLWRATDVGYQFNDWERYQLTKAQLEADADAAKERMRKFREGESSPEQTENEQRTNGVRSPDVPVSVPLLPLSVSKEVDPPQVADARVVTMIENRLGTTKTKATAILEGILNRQIVKNQLSYVGAMSDPDLRKLLPAGDNSPPSIRDLCDHGRHRDFCPECKSEGIITPIAITREESLDGDSVDEMRW